jgi:hypothetical protein
MKQTSAALSALERLAAGALHENPGWLDEAVNEREASRIVNEAVATLRSKRTRGGGPIFTKNSSTVSYIRRDLFEYLVAGRRTSTSDSGRPA